MAENFDNLSVKADGDASGLVSAFDDGVRAAKKFENSLTTLGTALSNYFNLAGQSEAKTKNIIGKDQAKDLSATLSLYNQLSGAVKSYATAANALNSSDGQGAQERLAKSLASLRSELNKIKPLEGQRLKDMQSTLALYKQVADAANTANKSLISEADAKRRVAAASEKEAAARQKAAAASRGERVQTAPLPVGPSMAEYRKRQGDQPAPVSGLPVGPSMAEYEKRQAAERNLRTEVEATNQVHQRTRYALYEVSAAYTMAAAAAAGFVGAIAKSAIDYEAQFAQVMRTTQATAIEGQRLRDTFMEMSEALPVSFEEFSKIGTLGAQMGIATADLDEFAEVIAKFSATTDLSVEAASVGFGRLATMMSDLDASNFQNAASAISELGTASVATESEILTTAESIATTANMAGFTTEEVLGLATALTSLKVRPELARGGLQRIFAEINKSVGEGGQQLQQYAEVLGITAEQADNMWRTDPSAFFQRLAEAVGAVTDNVARQNMIRNELGITNSRDVEVLARLANGYDVYAQSMDLAADSYERGTYLDEEAGVIFETTAAAITRFGNAFKNMLSNLGESSLTPITMLAELGIKLFNVIGALPPEFTSVALAVAAVTAGYLAYQAVIGRSAATMIGFRQVQMDMNTSVALSLKTLTGLTAQMKGVSVATNEAAASTTRLTTAQAANAGAGRGAAAGNSAAAAATTAAGTAAAGATGMFARLGAVMKAHPILTAVYALSIAGTLAASLFDRFKGGAERAAESTEAFLSSVGGAQGLFEALKQDQEEFANGTQDIAHAYGTITVGYATAEAAAADNSEVMRNQLLPAHREAGAAVTLGAAQMEKSTMALNDNTLAIGENAEALIRQAYANQDFWNDIDLELAMRETGFDPARLYQEISGAGFGEAGREAGRDYIDGLMTEWTEATLPVDRSLWEEGYRALEEIKRNVGDAAIELSGMNNQAIISAAVMGDLDAAAEENGDTLEDTAEAAASLREALSGVVDEAFALIDAEAGLNASLQSLGESIAENGTSFATSTAEGRANLEALQSTMQATAEMFISEYEAGNITAQEAALGFAQYVDELMLGLEQLGVDTSQFDALRLHLDELFRDEIHVQVGTAAAIGALYELQGVAEETWALLRQGDGWGAYFGTDSAWQKRNRNRSNTPARTPSSRSGMDAVRDAYNAAQAARAAESAKKAADEQKKVADEQKRAADEAERHAKAVEDLEKQISDVHKEIAEINDEGRIFEEIVKRTADEMNRVFDENYGLMQATDAMELSLIKMRDNVQANVDKVKDLREEYHKLRREAAQARVDERQARLFQSIARMYGDTERDISYGAEAAEAAAVVKEKENLAAAAKKEADEIDKNRLALTGYSEQAITNRGDLVDLQQQMVKMIEEYAKTGATTEEVTEYTERLRRKFIDQATQMGYNEQDVRDLAGVFDDLITVINEVPRDVRIEVDADTAAARAKLRQLTNELEKERTVPVTFRSNQQELTVSGDLRVGDIVARQIDTPVVNFRGGGGGIAQSFMARGGVVPGHRPADNFFDNMLATTGSRLINLQSGEGIVTNRAMDYYGGKDFIDSVNNRQYPRGGGYSVTQVFTGPEQIRIAPDQIDELARKVSMIVGIDGRTVANTANRYNVSATNRGQ